ncbi:hypothetical protein V3C99_001842 [Haemonchus contortus]
MPSSLGRHGGELLLLMMRCEFGDKPKIDPSGRRWLSLSQLDATWAPSENDRALQGQRTLEVGTKTKSSKMDGRDKGFHRKVAVTTVRKLLVSGGH